LSLRKASTQDYTICRLDLRGMDDGKYFNDCRECKIYNYS
jgi:hypothetical protein